LFWAFTVIISAMIMIAVFVTFVGVCLGSFVNALVWRTRQKELIRNKAVGKKLTKTQQEQLKRLSIVSERSRCTHCDHELGAKDLVPVLSYLYLRGKCRYCGKKIEDTPIAELFGGAVALASYALWPLALDGVLAGVAFAAWLVLSALLLALALYDARWQILPDRLVAAATVAAALFVILASWTEGDASRLLDAFWGGLLIGGLFYLLHQISGGRWIGGGDVKLGFALGVIAGSLSGAFLVIFGASLLGTLYAVGISIVTRQPLNGKVRIPFGPFLILAAVITFLVGSELIEWYRNFLLGL